MNRKARQELIGIGALAIGLFLGLTLLRLPITGSWGDQIGSRLWRVLGVGSVLLPVLGIGWALAAFERLGSLSAARAAALGGGLILLLPYGIGTVAGADFPPAYAAWSPTRSEEHTSELQSPCNLVCRLLLEKKKKKKSGI